jgi:hypothetical protein
MMTRDKFMVYATARLIEAYRVGMVRIDFNANTATVCAPPNDDQMSDAEWLNVLQAAGEVGRELESLGFDVRNHRSI